MQGIIHLPFVTSSSTQSIGSLNCHTTRKKQACTSKQPIPIYLPNFPIATPCPSPYLVEGFYLTVLSGNLLNKSPRWSIGAVIRPTTVSKGGLSGADGWLRDGTNALVRPNDLTIDSLLASPRELCRAGKSSFSSSLMCWLRGSIIALRAGMNSEVPALRNWKTLSFSLSCKLLAWKMLWNYDQRNGRDDVEEEEEPTFWCSFWSFAVICFPFFLRFFSNVE